MDAPRPMKDAPRREHSRILGFVPGCGWHTLDYRAPYRYPAHIEHDEQWVQVSDSGRATSFHPVCWLPLPPDYEGPL